MAPDKNQSQTPEENNAVNIGNASNPSPESAENERMSDNQFLSAGAEKYLREAASVEDYPDAGDQQDMDTAIDDEKNKE